MISNPALGVFFHWLGGLSSASFYVPYRGVRDWAWETYWLVGGFFSWIIAPWIFALTMTKDLIPVLRQAPAGALLWTYTFGVLWGLGGLTFGLTMRYLGMSLGMAVALGYTAAFGTLMPPIFRGVFVGQVLGTRSGLLVLGGVAICLLGIAFAGAAGLSKEREISEAQKHASIKEFNLKKGLLVATFSGVMSACFAYGLAAGDPIKAITLQHGTAILWQGLPVLIVVLAGGFTTNFIWCVVLNIRNRTGYQYFESEIREGVPRRNVDHILEPVTDAPGEEMAVAVALPQEKPRRAPMFSNYQFSAIAGTTWYMQFFFYTMGETQMGRYKFSSWTLHMASIIIFSTLWGIALHEWKGTGRRTKLLLAFSLLVLVTSTVVVGYGNYRGRPDALTLPIKQNSSKHAAFRELLEICHPPCKSFCAVLFHLFSGRRGFGKPVVEGIERLSSEKASSADRSFSGDHDCAATPNIPSAPLRCVCSNPYALDEFPVPTDCSRRFLENGNPSSLREKLSQLRAKVERSV